MKITVKADKRGTLSCSMKITVKADKRVPCHAKFNENNMYFFPYSVQIFNGVTMGKFSICYRIVF
jgi:hypothetical protein